MMVSNDPLETDLSRELDRDFDFDIDVDNVDDDFDKLQNYIHEKAPSPERYLFNSTNTSAFKPALCYGSHNPLKV